MQDANLTRMLGALFRVAITYLVVAVLLGIPMALVGAAVVAIFAMAVPVTAALIYAWKWLRDNE